MSKLNVMSIKDRYLIPLNDVVILEDGSESSAVMLMENDTVILTKGALDIIRTACLEKSAPVIKDLTNNQDDCASDITYRFIHEQNGFKTVNHPPKFTELSINEPKKGSEINVKGFGSVTLTEDTRVIERTISTGSSSVSITLLKADCVIASLIEINTPISISTGGLADGKLPSLIPENRGGIGVAASCSACGGCGTCGACTLCGEVNFAAGAAFAAATTFAVHLGLTAEVIRHQGLIK